MMAESESTRRLWIKPVIGFAAVFVGIALAWNFGVFDLISMDNLDRLNSWFDDLGPWAPIVFILMWIAAAVFFLPGLPLTIAGGLVFGPVWGTIWTTVGANLGAVAAFVAGRFLARRMVERRMASSERLQHIDAGVRRHGWRMLLITRLVPVFPFNIQNYVYGITDIRLSTFVLVSLPAMLPATIAYTFVAGSLRTGDLGRTLWFLGIAAVLFVVMSFVPGWVAARWGDSDLQSQN